MNKTKLSIRHFSAVFVVALGFLVSGCNYHQTQGLTAYNDLAYSDAIDHLEKVKNKDYQTYITLANSHMMLSEYEDAVRWYNMAYSTDRMRNEDYLNYAEALHATGDYKAAELQYYTYLRLSPNDERAQNRFAFVDNPEEFYADTTIFATRLLPFSESKVSDYGITPYDSGLVFTSERDLSNDNKTVDWTDRHFSEMYYVEEKQDGTFSNPRVFAKNLKTAYGEGLPVFSEDERTVYFTSHNFVEGELNTDDDDVVHLQIMRSEKDIDGTWKKPEVLGINSDEFSTMHPAISADGRWLYFASNRGTGAGGADLYVAYIDAKGKVNDPIHLGNNINTEGDELFPVVNVVNGNEYLYFSSDGHEGPGGLDLFKISRNSVFVNNPQLLQYPINSIKNDFVIHVNSDGKSGYLTSNRDNDDGIDNLYSFSENIPQVLRIHVRDENNHPIIAEKGVNVTVDNKALNSKDTLSITSKGVYIAEIDNSFDYDVVANATNRETAAKTIDPVKYSGQDTINVFLALDKVLENELTDHQYTNITFRNIYYDFDESYLTKSAKIKLDSIASILSEEEDFKVKLAAHADSRGSDAYNKNLTQARVQSAYDYLIAKGVDEDQLVAEAHGERHLENKCDDGVECKESLHQENRRTEFFILEAPDSSELSEEGDSAKLLR